MPTDKFKILTIAEFAEWLKNKKCIRAISILQNHHTYLPAYKQFKGDNHLALLKAMEDYHIHNNGWSEIAQTFTTFPDGKIAICRDLDKIPAGIKGANQHGICMEHLGNFDLGQDKMTDAHKECIVSLNALLCNKFKMVANTDHIVYHHWYDLKTGERRNGAGSTKSCPGTAFFEGNSVIAANKNFIPLIAGKMKTF
jgi:hypothetical protein